MPLPALLMSIPVRLFTLTFLLQTLLTSAGAMGADKVHGTITVRDALTTPGRAALIEAKLARSGLLTETGLGGEPLELVIAGKPVATAMTGGDGRALLEYHPMTRGTYPVTVRLGATPRVTAAEEMGTLAVWEKRRPLLLVEVASLIEPVTTPPLSLPPLPGLSGGREQSKPMADAADELGRLTKFYYNVIYLSSSAGSGASLQGDEAVRRWLNDHKFPTGVVMTAKPGPAGLGTMLDEFKADGWITLKTGIVRSPSVAEVLLEHRLEAILVPEPARGEVPRKAKVAKDWKDVRKKL